MPQHVNKPTYALVLSSNPNSGGAHSFENQLLEILSSLSATGSFTLKVFYPERFFKPRHRYTYSHSRLRQVFAHLRSNFFIFQILRVLGVSKGQLEKRIAQAGAQVAIFATPNHLSVGFNVVPFATTVWDFGHRDLPHSRETSTHGLWAFRESLFQKTLARSVFIMVDSDATARKARSIYGVSSERVEKIGLLPEKLEVSAVETSVPLDKPYIVYPAKHWPHKNHKTLFQAMSVLTKKNVDINLILTGESSRDSAFENILEKLEIRARVQIMGKVSRSELGHLIAGSKGLVMPSLLGPSNLPPLEAALIGVPSLISDKHEMSDLLLNARLVRATSVEAWATAIEELLRGEIQVPTVVDIDVSQLLSKRLEKVSNEISNWRPLEL